MSEEVTVNLDVRGLNAESMDRLVRERIFPTFLRMLRENRDGATLAVKRALGPDDSARYACPSCYANAADPPRDFCQRRDLHERTSVSVELYRSATATAEQSSTKWQMVGDVPRRARVDLATPAERVIRDAIYAVEDLPADTRLTDAVVLLGQALNKVADFVEDVK